MVQSWTISESFGIELQEHERRAFLERRAQQWVSTVRAAQAAYEAHPVALRHRVTYEALRGATEAEVGSILDWLGVEVSPSRLAATVEKLSFENLPADRKGGCRGHERPDAQAMPQPSKSSPR